MHLSAEEGFVLALGTSRGDGRALALPEHLQHGQHVLQIPRIYGEERLQLGVHPPSLAPAGLQRTSRAGNVSVLTLNTNNDFKY